MSKQLSNGGVIGVDNTPTIVKAAGAWTMKDLAHYIALHQWPLAGLPNPVFYADSGILESYSGSGNVKNLTLNPADGEDQDFYDFINSGMAFHGTPGGMSDQEYFICDGTNDLSLLANSQFIKDLGKATSQYTIEAWLVHKSGVGSQALLATCPLDSSSNHGVGIGLSAANGDTSLLQDADSTPDITVVGIRDTIEQIVFVVDNVGVTAKGYVNGVLNSSSFTQHISASDPFAVLSWGSDGSTFMKTGSKLFILRSWNELLTDDQVLIAHNQIRPRFV